MRKAERLFQILNILRSRRGVTTAEHIAEELNVSMRTVYRDIQALSLSNIPIQSEAGVGYRLQPGFSLPPMMFEEDELEALLLGAKMVKGWSDSELGQAAQRALDKIHAVLPDRVQAYHQHDDWLIVTDFERELVSQFSQPIRHAVKKRLILNLHYQREDGRKSTRSVLPLGLIYWGKVWTLVAWCELRKDYRLFRLDRIKRLDLTEKQFEILESRSLGHFMSLQTHKNQSN